MKKKILFFLKIILLLNIVSGLHFDDLDTDYKTDKNNEFNYPFVAFDGTLHKTFLLSTGTPSNDIKDRRNGLIYSYSNAKTKGDGTFSGLVDRSSVYKSSLYYPDFYKVMITPNINNFSAFLNFDFFNNRINKADNNSQFYVYTTFGIPNSESKDCKIQFMACSDLPCADGNNFNNNVYSTTFQGPGLVQMIRFNFSNAGNSVYNIQINDGDKKTGMFDPTTGELFLFFYATNPNDQKKCIIDIGPIFTSYDISANSLFNPPESGDCINGTTLNNGECKECHYTCLKCNDQTTFSSTNCSTCSPYSENGDKGPNNGNCGNLNYLNLNGLNNPIEISNTKHITSTGYTIGFWFLSNTSAINFLKIVYESHLMIVLQNSDSTKQVTPICYVGIQYQDPDTFLVDKDTHESFKTSTFYGSFPKLELQETTVSRWNYIRCQYSNSEISSDTNVGGGFKTSSIKRAKDIKPAFYYDGGYVNPPPRKFFTTDPKLKIFNVAGTNNKDNFFIRNIVLFADYIPPEIQFQYFDFDKLNFSTTPGENTFPSLSMFVKLDNINITSDSAATFTSKNCAFNECETITNNLTINNKVKFIALKGFTKIILPPNGKTFNSKLFDDADTKDYTCSDSNAKNCFNDDKILSCKNDFFWDNTSPNPSCTKKCLNGMPSYLLRMSDPKIINDSSKNTNTGFCSGFCSSDETTGFKCSTLNLENSAKFISSLTCSLNNYTVYSFFCIQKDLTYAKDTTQPPTGALLYSYKFNSPTIEIKISPLLTIYHLEIWHLPDKIFDISTTFKICFATDSIQIQNFSTTYFIKLIKQSLPFNANSFKLKFNQWNKISYSVITNASNSSNRDFMFHHMRSTDYNVLNSTENLDLSSIGFCTRNCDTWYNSGPSLTWSSGAYKLLKVWDATNFSLDSYLSLNRYFNYNNYIKQPRFMNNILFLPMSFPKMKYNKIQDMDFTDKDINVPSNPDPLDIYPQINYVEDLEFVGINKYVSELGTLLIDFYYDTPTTITIDSPDKWKNDNESLQCVEKAILSSNSPPKCEASTDSKSVFVSPGINKIDNSYVDVLLKPIDLTSENEITIKFSMKILGFSKEYSPASNNTDIFYYSDNLYLTLNKIDSSRFDLSLVYKTGIILSTYSNFQTFFSKWVNIVISLSDYSNNTTYKGYYPNKLNFQINNKNMDIDGTSSKLVKITDFAKMKISKPIIALWSKGIISFNYFNGFMGIYTSINKSASGLKYSKDLKKNSKTDMINIFNGDSFTDCLSDYFEKTNLNINCVFDLDNTFDETKYICDLSLLNEQTGTCYDKKVKCPLGFIEFDTNNDYCSCSNVDKKLMGVFKTGSKSVCRNLDYLDLTRFNDFELSDFSAEITTKQYTFEVWIYSQTYIAGTFNMYSFIWNRYLRIDIKGKTANNYSSTCYPLYEESDTNKLVNKFDVDFTSDQLPWVYLRCSVDIVNKKYFHYQEKSSTTEQDLNTSLTDILPGTASLKFVNNSKNRGILFFRLLKLYNCYDCLPIDHYRKDFRTVSVIQNLITSNNLLYHIDGKITGFDTIDRTDDNAENKQVINYILDQTGVKSFALTPLSTDDFLGYNVLDFDTPNKYGQLNTDYLCTENSNFCTGLVKLNEVTDIKISSVPPSLNGQYTIEFWTMISNISNLTNGFHIIWKGLGSVTIIKDKKDSNSINMICWSQDFQFKTPNMIENKFGDNIYSILDSNSIPNFEKKTRSSLINNKWLFVRCAVDSKNKIYHSILEDGNSVIQIENRMTDTTPMSPIFSDGQTTYVLINGISGNSDCTIYLRNLFIYPIYVNPSNITKFADMNNLTKLKYWKLALSINFDKLHKQINKLPYVIDKTEYSLILVPITKLGNKITLTFDEKLKIFNLAKYSTTTYFMDKIDKTYSPTNSEFNYLHVNYYTNPDASKKYMAYEGYYFKNKLDGNEDILDDKLNGIIFKAKVPDYFDDELKPFSDTLYDKSQDFTGLSQTNLLTKMSKPANIEDGVIFGIDLTGKIQGENSDKMSVQLNILVGSDIANNYLKIYYAQEDSTSNISYSTLLGTVTFTVKNSLNVITLEISKSKKITFQKKEYTDVKMTNILYLKFIACSNEACSWDSTNNDFYIGPIYSSMYLNTDQNNKIENGTGKNLGCFPGYSFDTKTSKCSQECNYTCLQCKDDLSSIGLNDCISCHPISSNYNKIPSDGTCGKLEYLDITKISNNIEIENENHIYSSGYTLGFWFFSSESNIGNNAFRVIYEDNIMITIITDPTSSNLDAYCFIGLEFYDIVKFTDTAVNLKSLINSADEQQNLNFSKSQIIQTKWRYIRCAYSYSRKKYYLDVNGEGFPDSKLTEKTLNMPVYFTNEYLKLPPRKFYNSNPKLTISSITGLPSTTQYIFVRNIAFFADYIHPNIYFHYNDFKTFKSSTPNEDSFSSLNLSVNFNDIDIVNNSKFTFTWNNCQLNSCKRVYSSNISYSGSLRPSNLNGFIRLNIPNIGYVNMSPDLRLQSIQNCDSNAQYCISNTKILACKNDYFWNVDSSDNQSCSQTCTSGFPTYLYQPNNSLANSSTQNTNSGYCIGSCSSSKGDIACPTVNLTPDNYGTNLQCNDTPNYTKFSIFCLEKNVSNPVNSSSNSGSLFYSQGFNSPTIEINLQSTLSEYHVEFWFVPDLNYLYKNQATGKYYIFWTNSISIKKDTKLVKVSDLSTNDYKIYNGSDSNSIIPSNLKKIEMKNGQWIKISYSVIKNNSNWDINYYYKNDNDDGYKKKGLSTNPSLNKIVFCTNNCKEYFIDGAWYSGIYKYLKVWDANLIDFDTYRQTYKYFNYENSYKFPRIQSNILFYSFTINKLFNNNIDDMNISTFSINVPKTLDAKDIYHQLNFLPDSLFVNQSNYLDLIINPSKVILPKPTGKSYKDSDYDYKNDNDNMMCSSGKLYSFTASPPVCKTQANSHTVIVTPPIDSTTKKYVDLSTVKIDDKSSNEVTIKFFVKFLGFTYIGASDLKKFNNLNDEFYFYKYGNGLSIIIKKLSSTNYQLKLYNIYNSANTLVATYDNFQNRIGKWTFIVLSYSNYNSDDSIKTYYPEKLNWQVGNKVTQTNEGTYANIPIADLLILTIPKEITALWTRLMISYNYFTGFMGIYSNSGATTGLSFSKLKKSSITDITDIYKGSSASNCLTNTYFDNLANIQYSCVDDYDNIIVEENNNYNCNFTGLDDTGCFISNKTNCPFGYFDTSNDYCSCSNVDKKLMLISKNNNSNFCKLTDYIDYSRYEDIEITDINSAVKTKEYTMQFWVYIQSYKQGGFGNYSLQWNKHLKIDLGYKNGNYISTCYPIYEQSNNSYENSNKAEINFSREDTPWEYLRCSVNISSKLYLFHNKLIESKENPLLTSLTDIPSEGTGSFKFVNGNKNRGIIYLRLIRLYNCYDCQEPDEFQFNWVTPSLIGNQIKEDNLMYHIDEKITGYNTIDRLNDEAVTKQTIKYIKSEDGKVFETSQITPIKDTEFLGYNVIDLNPENYTILSNETYLFSEDDPSSYGFIKLNEVENVKFENITPSYNGRYTFEFWYSVDDIAKLTSGFHIIWKNLASVTIVQENTSYLSMFCWPQDFKLNEEIGANIENIYGADIFNMINNKRVLNYDKKIRYSTINKVWTYVRCAVNTGEKVFYSRLEDNNVQTPVENELKSDVFYNISGTSSKITISNDYPFRYYFQNNAKTYLLLAGMSKNKDCMIYVRNIYLFTEYLPMKMDFRHIYLKSITSAQMPSLVFSINFSLYRKRTNKLPYINEKSTENYSFNFIKINGVTIVPTFTKKLRIKKLCSPTKPKFNPLNNLCLKVNSCTNARLCIDEEFPIICNSGYVYDPLTSPNPRCNEICSSNTGRGIMSDKSTSFCNRKCDNNMNKCQFLNNSQTFDNFNNNVCSNGYDRYGYKCIPQSQSKKSYLYFNGCLNFVNFQKIVNVSSNYTLEFWIKLDRINEFCKISDNYKKYYLIADPHVIYSEPNSLLSQTPNNQNFNRNMGYTVYYQMLTNLSVRVQLKNFSQFNWNHVMIQLNSDKKIFRVITNFNFFNPDFSSNNFDSTFSSNALLKKIVFCSNNDSCPGTTNKNYLNNVTWGAALYKDLRISEGSNWNYHILQESISQSFSEFLKFQTFYIQFSVNQSIDNYIMNMNSNKNGINLYDYISNGPLNDIDKDMLINYSSNLDNWEKDAIFVESQELLLSSSEWGLTTINNCSNGCKKCISNLVKQCLECLDGYKLYLGICKKTNGVFLKVPLLNLNKRFLILKANDISKNFYLEKEPIFTLTVWIKFFGQLFDSSIECVTIFRFTKDGNRYICYNTRDNSLYFYEGSSVIYIDSNVFLNFVGQWCLISISNYNYKQNDPEDLSNYFPKLQNFNVHDKQIKKVGPNLPSGWTFNTFDIGYDFSAMISDIRIYRNFIINPYAYVTNDKKEKNLFFYYPLDSKSNNFDCVTDSIIDLQAYTDIGISTDSNSIVKKIGIECKNDFHPYILKRCTNQFFNYTDIYNSDSPCFSCDKSCNEGCVNSGIYDCQCDFTSGNQIIRFNYNTTTHYCENLPYQDFSKIDSMDIPNVKVSNTGEYSMEFWMYLYSYNKTYVAFDNEEIIWDLHSYIKVSYFNNTFGVTCNPVYQIDSAEKYKIYEKEDTIYKNIMNWIYVSCSVNIPLNKFTTLRREFKLNTEKDLIPNNSNRESTKLVIRAGRKSRTNYGFLFIKNLRLWSIYDITKIETNCYPPNGKPHTFALLHFFDSKLDNNQFKDMFTGISGFVINRSDFIGYNVVDSVATKDIIKPDDDICSSLSVVPSTGVLGDTKFLIMSNENEYFPTNIYKFSYYEKGNGNFNLRTQIPNPDNSRQIRFVFPKENSKNNSTSANYLVFSEIQTPNNFITLLDEIIIYTSKENFLTFSNTTSTNLTNEIINAMPNLSKDMKTQDILTSSMILTELLIDNNTITDKILNSTESVFISSNNLKNSTIKAKINLNGTLDSPAKVKCDDDFCNKKGYCVEISNFKRDCKCLSGFSGINCQIDIEKEQIFKEKINNLSSIIKFQALNNTVNNSTLLDKNIYDSLNVISLSIAKMNPEIPLLTDMVDSLNLLTDNKTSLQDSIIINSKNKSIFNTVDNLLETSLFLSEKQKYQNLEKKYLSGEINKTVINVIPIDLNKTSVSSFSQVYNNNKKRILYPKETLYLKDKIAPKDINLSKKQINNNQRRLQTNSNSNNNKTNNFVLQVLDENLLALTNDQYQDYMKIYEKIKNILNNLIDSLLRVNKNSTLDFYKFNNFYEYYVYSISDLQNFDFNKYFEQRRLNYLAYFDAIACLKEFTKRTWIESNYDFSIIYMIFFNYNYPKYNFDNEVKRNSISLSYFIKFFDATGKEIIINDCKDAIIHYIPIYPNNQNFIKSYNLNPQKFYKSSRKIPSNSYMPYFISSEGEIDKNNTLETQKSLYYRDYNIHLTYYDTITKNYTSFNNNETLYSNNNSYIIAFSNSTGLEIALFAEYAPVNQKLPNTYFFNYNEIFKNGKNFQYNISFYILFALLFLFLVIFVLLITLKNLKKYNNYYDWYNYESRIKDADDKCFGHDRDGYISNLNKEYYTNQIEEKSNDINIKNKKKNYDTETTNLKNNIIEEDDKKIEEDKKIKSQIEMTQTKSQQNMNNQESGKENQEQNVNLKVSTHNLVIKEIKDVENKKERSESKILNSNFRKNEANKEFNNKSRCYNIFYFIGKRNIYANLFILSSPFDPKYKLLCKFSMFIFFQLLITSLLFILGSIDFSAPVYLDGNKLIAYLVSSVFVTNTFIILLSIILRVTSSVKEDILKNDFKKW